MSWVADVLARRGAERVALIERARAFVDELGEHLDIRAASIGGSVARGDFNVWSDVDVVLVVDELPERLPGPNSRCCGRGARRASSPSG